MAVGKEVGEFNMTSTSMTLQPGRGEHLSISINFEGTASGYLDCDLVATMTIDSRDGKNGNYQIYVRCIMADGELLDNIGDGKTELIKDHVWSVAGVTEIFGKRSWAIQGKINFDDRSFNGKMYERQ